MAKAIIAGKRYDTETATEVAASDNGHALSDFSYCRETLWRTRLGRWFIEAAGGPMSRYAKNCGDSTGWGEEIVPMPDSTVLEWLERHNEIDAIETYFAGSIVDA
jgi:hypothetical protein